MFVSKKYVFQFVYKLITYRIIHIIHTHKYVFRFVNNIKNKRVYCVYCM